MNLRGGFALATLLCLWPNLATLAADATSIDSDRGSIPDNPLARQALDRLSATLARPLFVRTRTRPSLQPPAIVRVEAPVTPPPTPPVVTLLGILKSDDDTTRAVLRSGAPAKIIQVRVGDLVDSWTVTEITGRRVILSLDSQSTTIRLFKGLEPRPARRADAK